MKHIAEEAGVSIATVSMALGGYPQVSEDTRRRIQQICERLDYKPTRRRVAGDAAKSTQLKHIGLLLLGSPLQFEGNQHLLQSLTVTTSRRSVRLEVQCVESADQVDANRQQLLEGARNLDGVILCGHIHPPLLQDLAKERIPHIIFGPLPHEEQGLVGGHGQIVTPDPLAMAQLATKTLIDDGHRRIAFLCRSVVPGLWNEQWLRGYRYTLLDAGIRQDPALVHTLEHGASAADALMRLPNPPTAWVIPAPDDAVGLIVAMRKKGQEASPQSIIGGGHTWSFQRPGTGYCRLVAYDLEHATELLLRQLGQLYRAPLPCPTRLLIPFQLMNPPEQ